MKFEYIPKTHARRAFEYVDAEDEFYSFVEEFNIVGVITCPCHVGKRALNLRVGHAYSRRYYMRALCGQTKNRNPQYRKAK